MEPIKTKGLKGKCSEGTQLCGNRFSVQPSYELLWLLPFWRSSQYLFIAVFLLTTKQRNLSMGVHFTILSVPLCFTFWLGLFEVGPVVHLFTSVYFPWSGIQRRKMAFQSLWGDVYASFHTWGSKHSTISTTVVLHTFRYETPRKADESYGR